MTNRFCHVRRLIPIVALLSAACSDRAPTGAAPVSPLDETSAVSVRVNAELALMRETGFERTHASSERRLQSVIPWLPNARDSRSDDGPRTIVKHFKQADRRTLSLGWHFKKGADLPATIFAFEDGKIRAVVGLEYARHGGGYLRRKARVTTFDSEGRPTGRIDLSSDPLAISGAGRSGKLRATMVQFGRDVLTLFTPKDLHAEETGCRSEYLTYLSATVKLAAASAALQIAGASCLTVPGTQPISCPAAGAAFVAWAEALDKWNLALDKLIVCTDAANQSGASNGTFSSSGNSDGNDDDDTLPIEQIVREFIDDAVAKGNYVCTPDGQICSFYAE